MADQTWRPEGFSEPQKSYVTKNSTAAIPPAEYDQGDKVTIGVVEDGVQKQRKMVIVEAKLREGRRMYQIKADSEGAELHRDENGNDWFKEDDLELWPEDDE